jgi:pyridoxamine 5'-phosphate oxidase-like protein
VASAVRVEPRNLDVYGHKPLAWSRAKRLLTASSRSKAHLTYWLATRGREGPNIAGVGAIWADDQIYFVSGPRTRKSRNLAREPRCAIAVSLRRFDLVLEGTARRVTDQPTLRRIVRRYVATGWPAKVEGAAFTAAFSAPSAGRPPWYLYALAPTTAFGVAGSKPYGATRWRFKKTSASSR